MPPVEKAREHPDESIMSFADKGFHEWPYLTEAEGFDTVVTWRVRQESNSGATWFTRH